MKHLRKAVIFAGVIGSLTLGHLAVSPAAAQNVIVGVGVPGFNFSFDTGGVAYAYSDGYWDHEHHWHNWRNAREAREFRTRYADRYDSHRHDRIANAGWREERREEERHEERREERHDDRR